MKTTVTMVTKSTSNSLLKNCQNSAEPNKIHNLLQTKTVLKIIVKIMVTKIMKLSRRASYEEMAETFPDFEIQESRELKENS